MDRLMRGRDYLTLNVYWWGLSTATGIVTPVLLPSLVALLVPWESKTTYLAVIRVVSLAVAMAVQPAAGLLSDRSTSPWGRRRPYVAAGTLAGFLFLALIGLSPSLAGSPLDRGLRALLGVSAAYLALLVGVVLWQGSANVAQGAMQGLIPDLVPEDRRGRAAGFKAVMEVLAVVPVVLVGPWVDAGRYWATIAVIVAAASVTLLVTVAGVRETPLAAKPSGPVGGRLLRLAGLAALFVAVTQVAVLLVRAGNAWAARWQASLAWRATVVGLGGLLAMAGAIGLGVRLGLRVGLGRDARHHRPFVSWVTNRLLYFAAVGSIQGFVLYYLADVHRVANPAAAAAALAAVLALSLVPSAVGGGYLADRLGSRRLVVWAGLAAAAGTVLLVFAPGLVLVAVGAFVLGAATGTFMAANWALGTELAPPQQAGRFLGIANIAGAGAGIVGAGIGGPLADMVNTMRPGLGYQVVFAIYAALFLLSAAVLVPRPERMPGA